MPQSLVIVNTNASQVRNRAARIEVVARLTTLLRERDDTPPHVVETGAQHETRPLVETAIREGATTVVGVGGDGTLRDIATALIGTEARLGIVPAGTGNQLASVLGVPLSLQAAVASLTTAVPRKIDIGEVTVWLEDEPEQKANFTIGVGLGFDARLMASTPQDWKDRVGRTAYFAQALRLAADVGVAPYRIDIDGTVIETEATIALIGNMGQLVPGVMGPRLPLVPDDGLLDLIVVGARGPLHGLKGLVDQMFRTSLGGVSGQDSLRLRGAIIKVEADRPEPLEVDGDYIGDGSLEARVLPAAIEVLVPLEAD